MQFNIVNVTRFVSVTQSLESLKKDNQTRYDATLLLVVDGMICVLSIL